MIIIHSQDNDNCIFNYPSTDLLGKLYGTQMTFPVNSDYLQSVPAETGPNSISAHGLLCNGV